MVMVPAMRSDRAVDGRPAVGVKRNGVARINRDAGVRPNRKIMQAAQRHAGPARCVIVSVSGFAMEVEGKQARRPQPDPHRCAAENSPT